MNTAITSRPDAAAWLSRLHARATDRIKDAADRALLQACSLHLAGAGGWPTVELETPEGRPLSRELSGAYQSALAGVLADASAGLSVLDPPDAASDAAAGLAGLMERALARVGPAVALFIRSAGARLVSVDPLTATIELRSGLPAEPFRSHWQRFEQAMAEVLGQRVALAVVIADDAAGPPEGES
jgi:nucleotide-binding universal stress UspA family protein